MAYPGLDVSRLVIMSLLPFLIVLLVCADRDAHGILAITCGAVVISVEPTGFQDQAVEIVWLHARAPAVPSFSRRGKARQEVRR